MLRLAAKGMSNRQVAQVLNLAEATVKRHLANVYPKLGVSSRTEAAIRLINDGLISSDHLLEGSTPNRSGWWGRFLQVEQHALQARRDGKFTKALGDDSKFASPDPELDRFVQEDRKRAQAGLVELLKEDGEWQSKRLEELTPEDIPARLEAERAKINLLMWRLSNWGEHARAD
ncbi:MAG: LuxR C-terminal-related transcriptional regulator [Actinobacteria bacterium]|nr:LuxR C-terminal-related transcriptional regulator [Actinomycetota bacterium]